LLASSICNGAATIDECAARYPECD
jgi:hypothetical protein